MFKYGWHTHLAQECSRSNVVENQFGEAVMENSNASALEMCMFSAKSTGVRSATFHHCAKTNTQEDKKLIGTELYAPLSKPIKG
eukprot:2157248-Ditylum_brightwellii.AAC.1